MSWALEFDKELWGGPNGSFTETNVRNGRKKRTSIVLVELICGHLNM